MALLLGVYLLGGLGWSLTLRLLGGRLRLGSMVSIWMLSLIGKYIPGSVGQIMSRIYLCEKKGVAKSATLISIVLEMGLVVVSGEVVFLASLFFGGMINLTSRIWVYLLVIPLGLVLLHPTFLNWSVNFALRKLKKGPVETLNLRYKNMVALLAFYLFFWMVYGVAFYLLNNAVHPVSIRELPTLTGIFAMSFVIGFLSIFVPAGLGVREGVMVLLLSFYMPSSTAIVISLLSRVWSVLADTLCFILSSALVYYIF